MSCSGLHCAGCGAGITVPPVAYAATLGLAWVAEHLAEVAAVSAGCGALAVAAVVALMRWQDRRQGRHGPLMVMRAEVLEAVPVIREVLTDPAGEIGTRVPISGPSITVNIFGMPSTEQAEVIWRALSGGN